MANGKIKYVAAATAGDGAATTFPAMLHRAMMRLPAARRRAVVRPDGAAITPWRCFCNAPQVVDTWVDPRGSFEAQRRAYKAELSQIRKQYAAEVAENQARVKKEHEEKTEMLRKVNLKVNDPELVACVSSPHSP
jgi:hypothetical protein